MTEHDLIDAPPHPVAGDSALQSQTLESVVSAYNYHAWLRHLAMPYLGSHPLELGSGLGDYAQAYLDAGIPRITVSEADPVRLAMLRRRFESQPRIAMLQLDLRAAPKREHSSAVAFNVLEHIEDDVGALRAASGLVRPGGSVVMLVPAFPLAMSDFDRRVGTTAATRPRHCGRCLGRLVWPSIGCTTSTRRGCLLGSSACDCSA